jgi:hypothetical protein
MLDYQNLNNMKIKINMNISDLEKKTKDNKIKKPL